MMSGVQIPYRPPFIAQEGLGYSGAFLLFRGLAGRVPTAPAFQELGNMVAENHAAFCISNPEIRGNLRPCGLGSFVGLARFGGAARDR